VTASRGINVDGYRTLAYIDGEGDSTEKQMNWDASPHCCAFYTIRTFVSCYNRRKLTLKLFIFMLCFDLWRHGKNQLLKNETMIHIFEEHHLCFE